MEPPRGPRRHPAVTHRGSLLVSLLLVLVAACGTAASPTPTPSPSPSSTPTPGPSLTAAELKLLLADRFGTLWYCDPDFYPVPRGEEIDHARERWPEVTGDTEAFAALTAKLGLDPAGAFTDETKLAVYRAWKVLNATALEPIGNDRYRFDYLAQPAVGAVEGTRTAGLITVAGDVTIEQEAAAGEPMCPICLAAGTRIETPDGAVAVDRLRIGDTVWTIDASGGRVPGTVLAVGSTPVPAGHELIRLTLADGRSVMASPGHPLADGRALRDLRPGDVVGGVVVAALERVPYDAASTYDIVVSGPTGTYLVDGIALGSTLAP